MSDSQCAAPLLYCGCYVQACPRTPAKQTKLFRWRISRIRSNAARELSEVEAPDADRAIKAAIEAFGVTDPWQQRRLVAQRLA